MGFFVRSALALDFRASGFVALLLAALAMVAVAGCTSAHRAEDDAGADGDGDADSDSDADADGDTDADVDSDADAGSDAGGDGGGDGSSVDAGADGDGEPPEELLPVGSACEDGAECAGGAGPAQCLVSLGALEFAGGYCSMALCFDASECPGGEGEAACIALGTGFTLCVDRCDEDEDCRAGYICADVDGAGGSPKGCVPSCRDDDGCPEGSLCDRDAAPPRCYDPEGGANGSPCAGNADCGEGSFCLAEAGGLFGGFPGGICTQECDGDADCTAGGSCVIGCENEDRNPLNDCDDDRVAGPDESNEGLCFESCSSADGSACPREGYTCTILGDQADPPEVCAPDCGEVDSPCVTEGYECDPSAPYLWEGLGTGKCQPRLDERDLGEACSLSSGCEGGFCLAEEYSGMPEGLCFEECTEGTDPCPDDSVCVAEEGEVGMCMVECGGDPDCRPGYECTFVYVGSTCLPACTSSDQCAYGCCTAEGWCDASRTGPCI